MTVLSFACATFNGSFQIYSKEQFFCLVDLTSIKTSHHVDLSGLDCGLLRKASRKSKLFPDGDWATQKVAIKLDDIARARRLKELAEANKDHDKAKDFHVLELQAMGKHSKWSIGYLWNSEFWYEKLSDYGRSIIRPFGWMCSITMLWTVFYVVASYMYLGEIKNRLETFGKSFLYSVSQMFAFIPSGRGARMDVETDLFGEQHDLIYALTFTQSALALILLFLLGLGLRHKYRI